MKNPYDYEITFAGDFTFETELWGLNDIDGVCDFTADNEGLVRLNSVKIIGRTFSASECEEWWGKAEIERITDLAQTWWADIGMADAADSLKED